MKKTYTKKQITEAIAFWTKRLNESIGSSQLQTTNLSMEDILVEQLDYDFAVEVTHGAKNNSSSMIEFSDEAINTIDNLMSSDEHRSIKKFYAAITQIECREEFDSEEHNSDYDDYVEDSIYSLNQRFSVYKDNSCFKPSGIAAFEGCSFDGKPKTFLIVVYSF